MNLAANPSPLYDRRSFRTASEPLIKIPCKFTFAGLRSVVRPYPIVLGIVAQFIPLGGVKVSCSTPSVGIVWVGVLSIFSPPLAGLSCPMEAEAVVHRALVFEAVFERIKLCRRIRCEES
jgi:hypothetical protein